MWSRMLGYIWVESRRACFWDNYNFMIKKQALTVILKHVLGLYCKEKCPFKRINACIPNNLKTNLLTTFQFLQVFIYFCFQIIGWDNEEYSDVCRASEFVTNDDIQYRFLSHLTPPIKTVNLYSKATNLWAKRLFKIKVQNIFMKNALSSFDMKLIFFISNFMSLLRFLNCHFSYLTERPVI